MTHKAIAKTTTGAMYTVCKLHFAEYFAFDVVLLYPL